MQCDPLVRIRTRPVDTLDTSDASVFGLAGWAVAAELLARMRDLNVISVPEAAAIIDRALSDLDESDLDDLAEQLNGPLVDGSRTALGRYLEAWRDKATRCTGVAPPD